MAENSGAAGHEVWKITSIVLKKLLRQNYILVINI